MANRKQRRAGTDVVMTLRVQCASTAILDLKRRLAEPQALFEAAPTDRAAQLATLAAIIDFLKAPGVREPKSGASLKALFDALADLDQGTVGPLVAPTSYGSAKPPLPTSTWTARAFLAAAVDLRHQLGEPLELSAERVLADVPNALAILGLKATSRDGVPKLRDLRKAFKSARLPGPSSGVHVAAWTTYQNLTAMLIDNERRSQALEGMYENATKMAAEQGALTFAAIGDFQGG